MSILGKYITDQRTAKNLSIRKLAELAHLSHTEIYRLETGERKNPSPTVLKSIAIALGIKFEDIMKAAGYVENEAPPTLGRPNDVLAVEDLSETELEEVRDFINFLRNKRKMLNL